jgi:3'-phosphoadenosine 5'-phosphosulfate sulfotransferase (PAPS reductase)/FAD synthetase
MADRIEQAMDRLRVASQMSLALYKTPLVIAYSGGKDSDALLWLAQKAGIPFEARHSLTTADAPETVYHVRDTFRRLEEHGIPCRVERHIQPDGQPMTMWKLIAKKGVPPMRHMRYCCSALKEADGKDRFVATGVRWAESARRRAQRGVLEVMPSRVGKKLILNNDNAEDRRLFESCQMKGARIVNPLVDWTDDDVLGLCETERIPMNSLYQKGFRRVGCIGCPMAGKHMREREFLRWPTYKRAYLQAFRKMLAARKATGKDTTDQWRTEHDVFRWWMEYDELPGQIDLLEPEEP